MALPDVSPVEISQSKRQAMSDTASPPQLPSEFGTKFRSILIPSNGSCMRLDVIEHRHPNHSFQHYGMVESNEGVSCRATTETFVHDVPSTASTLVDLQHDAPFASFGVLGPWGLGVSEESTGLIQLAFTTITVIT